MHHLTNFRKKIGDQTQIFCNLETFTTILEERRLAKKNSRGGAHTDDAVRS
jgi:hypothetical protein